jgi:hypothetical protein
VNAQTIAAVTHGLVEEYVNRWVGPGYVYHQFDGFPGFWQACGDAGEALDAVISESSSRFIDIVDRYVLMVADHWLREESADYDALAREACGTAPPAERF